MLISDLEPPVTVFYRLLMHNFQNKYQYINLNFTGTNGKEFYKNKEDSDGSFSAAGGNDTDSDCDYTPGKKKPFKCSICEATFTTKNTMKTHIDSIHDGKKLNASRVKCTICEKIFSSSSNIRTHISNKHKDVMIKGG